MLGFAGAVVVACVGVCWGGGGGACLGLLGWWLWGVLGFAGVVVAGRVGVCWGGGCGVCLGFAGAGFSIQGSDGFLDGFPDKFSGRMFGRIVYTKVGRICGRIR